MSIQVVEVGTLCLECNDHAWSPTLCEEFGHNDWALVDDVAWSSQDTDTWGYPAKCSVCADEIGSHETRFAVGIVWL
jgi:hypothetical protein